MHDDMTDAANPVSSADQGSSAEQAAADPVVSAPADALVGFCQQCGRGLTSASERRIGTGTFCPSCATARSGQTGTQTSAQAGAQNPAQAAWQPVNAATTPGAFTSAFPNAANPPQVGEPNPVLAGFLGLIPGVGAMYNGQYAKAAIHLVVFVVMVSLADNLNWVLWWFVWGWVFYQAFDAYHTAQARRDGQPLPNPFGWNDLGERFGATRGWTAPASRTGYPHAAAYAGFRSPMNATAKPSTPDTHFETASATVRDAGFAAGYPASSYPSPYSSSYTPPAADVPTNAHAPYAPTYTGTTSSFPATVATPEFTSRRFPTGAAWLIGLGVLFLLANLLPAWRLDGRWFVPVLLAGIAVWMGVHRLATARDLQQRGVPLPNGNPPNVNIPGLLLGPSLLLTVAILLGLQNTDLLPLRHSWPAFLIVWGALLLLEHAPGLALPVVRADTSGSVVPSATDAPSR